jgi:hypothetical protein
MLMLWGNHRSTVSSLKSSSTVLSIGKIVGISALMHMDSTLKGANVEFNKNTKQK